MDLQDSPIISFCYLYHCLQLNSVIMTKDYLAPMELAITLPGITATNLVKDCKSIDTLIFFQWIIMIYDIIATAV